MTDEPMYVEPGEEFDAVDDYSWRYIDDMENQDIVRTAFLICGGRKYFATPKEARKWRKIDGQITRGLIPIGWVKYCFEWARKKNHRVIAIKVDALGSLIINKAKMQDWLGSQPKQRSADDYV